MSLLEDHIHQAFSTLLLAKQEQRTLIFEQEEIAPIRGPINQNNQYDLCGDCGLLGNGHPLIAKSYMILALKGISCAPQESLEPLLVQANDHLSQLIGKDVCLSRADEASLFPIGRNTHVLSNEAYAKLESGQSITISGLIGDNFGITLKSKPAGDPQLSYSSLFLLSKVLKFVLLGQFYGENGLIKKRERQLKEKFSSLDSFKEVKGLQVELVRPIKSDKIIAADKTLIFPLSFDDGLLEDLLAILKEEECT